MIRKPYKQNPVQGCDCGQCPSHSNNGLRLLRYNDKITQWDNSFRRTLDRERYGLQFSPVTVQVSRHALRSTEVNYY